MTSGGGFFWSCRAFVDPSQAGGMRARLREVGDWDDLLRTAQEHGLLSLLFWTVKSHCLDAVPAKALTLLRSRFDANVQRTLFLTSQLVKLLQMFEEAGIGAVPFKGPTLAAAAYGNPALRESGDLDILVRKWDLARAMELCLRRGFEQKFDYHESSAAERFFAYKHILVRGPLIVELHWALSHRWFPLRFDLAHARERLVQTPFVGTTISEFAPEDQLLLLCVHGAGHEWKRLIWICDVAALVKARELDWEACFERSARVGGLRMLRLGLLLAHRLVGARLCRRPSTGRRAGTP